MINNEASDWFFNMTNEGAFKTVLHKLAGRRKIWRPWQVQVVFREAQTLFLVTAHNTSATLRLGKNSTER